MKRALGAAALLVVGFLSLLVYSTLSRDREYARLIAEGDQALAADRAFAAIEAYSGAIALKRESMLAYLKRGETHQRRGDWESALRDLRTAATLDPTAPRPRERLGDVNYVLERYARAEQWYAEYLQLDDRAPGVLYKLALARYREGMVAGAIPPLRQAVSQNERFAEAYYLLGVCLRDLDQPQDARVALEEAIALAPALVYARDELAALHRRTGQGRAEIEQLEALAALAPSAERSIGLASAYARQGRTELAVLTLDAAAERYPDEPAVYVAAGRLWLQVAESQDDRIALQKALQALRRAAADPRAPSDALSLLGRALMLSGQPDDAERTLIEATSRLPTDASAFAALAEVATRRGHTRIARDALVNQHALGGDPGSDARRSAFAARVATLSDELDEPAVAASWWQRAVDAAPGNLAYWTRLLEARIAAGDPAGARATLERALEVHPGRPELIALAPQIR